MSVYIYIYIYICTDILRKCIHEIEGGGRSRNLAGTKKLTKSSVRNGTDQKYSMSRILCPPTHTQK